MVIVGVGEKELDVHDRRSKQDTIHRKGVSVNVNFEAGKSVLTSSRPADASVVVRFLVALEVTLVDNAAVGLFYTGLEGTNARNSEGVFE